MSREPDTLIRLGKLLRRRRSPEQRRAVEEILSSTVSSSEKVRLVTEIDRKAQPGDQNSRETRRHYVGTPEDDATGRSVRPRKPPRVKAPLTRQGYFAFLFRARLRIREFGRTTNTIEAGGFPPSVRLSPNVSAFFSGFVKPSAQDIRVILTRLMDNAWMHLTKRDYNLLVLLIDFCRTIERTAASADDFRTNRALAGLRPIEDKLLALRYERQSVPRILESIETLRDRNQHSIKNLSAVPGLVSRLITRTKQHPSLIDAMLAVNMVAKRRFLTEDDLVLSGLGRIVETEAFDCSEETQARIQEFIDRIVAQLDALEQERREILKMRAFVKTNPTGDVSLGPLQELAAHSSTVSWKRLRDHPVQLAENLFLALTRLVSSVCNESLTLRETGTTPLFAERPFDADLERMRRATEAIRHLAVDLQSLRQDRFIAIIDKRETPTRQEADFLMHLQIYLDILAKARKQLQPLLQRPGAPGRDFHPIDLRRNTECGLPLDDAVLTAMPPVPQETLRVVLTQIIQLAYLTAFFFGDRKIRHLLKREHQLERDMEHLLESVQRIAPPQQAQEIVQRFLDSGR